MTHYAIELSGRTPGNEEVVIEADSCVEKSGGLFFYKDAAAEPFRAYGAGAWLSYKTFVPQWGKS